MQHVLVVAAHPEDEILGCGGTIARLMDTGIDVTVLLLGEGPLSRFSSNDVCRLQSASRNTFIFARKAGAILGVQRVITPDDGLFVGLPDNRFDTLPFIDIVKIIESVGAELASEAVLTHHGGDLNIDHRLTHQTVMTAFRSLPWTTVKHIWGFKVLSSTEYAPAQTFMPFAPHCCVNIESYLDKKIAALHEYASEMGGWPHPRSYEAVDHLARLRGTRCGVGAAEAFEVLQWGILMDDCFVLEHLALGIVAWRRDCKRLQTAFFASLKSARA